MKEPRSKGQWETFTPADARAALASSKGNRPLVKNDIIMYRDLMKNNRWNEDNPEPIIFDERDCLDEGHHRLTAQVEADVTMRWFVIRGVPEGVKLVLNSGRSRTDADSLKIAGYNTMTTHRCSTLKAVINGVQVHRQKSPKEVLAKLWEKYEQAIIFAESEMPMKYRQCALLGVIARAKLAGVPDDKLIEFKFPFVTDGDVCTEPSLQPIYKLKSWIDGGKINPSSGAGGRRRFVETVETALRFFLDEAELKNLPRSPKEELFPLPDEQAKVAEVIRRPRRKKSRHAAMATAD